MKQLTIAAGIFILAILGSSFTGTPQVTPVSQPTDPCAKKAQLGQRYLDTFNYCWNKAMDLDVLDDNVPALIWYSRVYYLKADSMTRIALKCTNKLTPIQKEKAYREISREKIYTLKYIDLALYVVDSIRKNAYPNM